MRKLNKRDIDIWNKRLNPIGLYLAVSNGYNNEIFISRKSTNI